MDIQKDNGVSPTFASMCSFIAGSERGPLLFALGEMSFSSSVLQLIPFRKTLFLLNKKLISILCPKLQYRDIHPFGEQEEGQCIWISDKERKIEGYLPTLRQKRIKVSLPPPFQKLVQVDIFSPQDRLWMRSAETEMLGTCQHLEPLPPASSQSIILTALVIYHCVRNHPKTQA